MVHYVLSGTDVDFPHAAYGTQLVLMSKVIAAADSGKHALLEAPTGSGKTAALLCSSLAWQQRLKREARDRKRDIGGDGGGRKQQRQEASACGGGGGGCCGGGGEARGTADEKRPPPPPNGEVVPSERPSTRSLPPSLAAAAAAARAAKEAAASAKHGYEAAPRDDDDDIDNEGFYPRGFSNDGGEAAGGKAETEVDGGGGGNAAAAPPSRRQPRPPAADDDGASSRAPRIFYTSRTHSQIAQVVRELKRTAYGPRTALLASREHLCVHPRVSAGGRGGGGGDSFFSKNDACDRLLQDNACEYFKGVPRLLAPGALPAVADVEELVSAGKRARACPYYASRTLAESADLVFAPYSYVLDPCVRGSLGDAANLSGALVIVDEAHNVEDTCREAASAEVDGRQLAEASQSLARAAALASQQGDARAASLYAPLAASVGGVAAWLRSAADGRRGALARTSFESFERVWSGPAATAALGEAGLGRAAVKALDELCREARTMEEEARERSNGNEGGRRKGAARAEATAAASSSPTASATAAGASALAVLGRLLSALSMMHESAAADATCPGGGVPSFRLAVRKSVERGGSGGGGGARGNGPSSSSAEWVPWLCVWALSPEPAFSSASRDARCFVLASGTLAPTASFASELGAAFPVRLEAPHVVDMERQVWAGSCGAVMLPGDPSDPSPSPTLVPLTATYKAAASFSFQDGVAECLVRACSVVPGGILAFFPSYAALDRLMTRWRATGDWERICAAAPTFFEPRGGGGGGGGGSDGDKKKNKRRNLSPFDAALQGYYSAVSRSKNSPALFLAVCRGKASEGLDFADSRARAVLVFGVPFPSATSSQVVEKKRFNDARAAAYDRGALPASPSVGRPLTGDQWYSQQAFRALNQAVGRCIRHRGDWGAVVLVDTRFGERRFRDPLPRWLRGSMLEQGANPHFGSVCEALGPFFSRLLADPPAAAAKARETTEAGAATEDAGEEDDENAAPAPRDERPRKLASLWCVPRAKRALEAAAARKRKEEEADAAAAAAVAAAANEEERREQAPRKRVALGDGGGAGAEEQQGRQRESAPAPLASLKPTTTTEPVAVDVAAAAAPVVPLPSAAAAPPAPAPVPSQRDRREALAAWSDAAAAASRPAPAPERRQQRPEEQRATRPPPSAETPSAPPPTFVPASFVAAQPARGCFDEFEDDDGMDDGAEEMLQEAMRLGGGGGA